MTGSFKQIITDHLNERESLRPPFWGCRSRPVCLRTGYRLIRVLAVDRAVKAKPMTEQEYISHLKKSADASPTLRMHVVDCTGRYDQFGEITEDRPLADRYELRDERHVSIYGLKSIYKAGDDQ